MRRHISSSVQPNIPNRALSRIVRARSSGASNDDDDGDGDDNERLLLRQQECKHNLYVCKI